MDKFSGFPDDSKLSATAFPATFFTELLPMIDDLAELKVVLYTFWALNQKEGLFRYLLREEYDNDILLDGLKKAKPDDDPQATLENALALTVARGILLCTTVNLPDNEIEIFCVNTHKGRVAISQVQAGEYKQGVNGRPIEILPERPNIYSAYENHIGLLAPFITDALKDAEKNYPNEWIIDAIDRAAKANKRNWRYIEAILKRWESEGRGDEYAGRLDEQDGKRYITGKYANFIEH
ncbi:MAG: DnaD domain protein [Anaerolineaceae bacterium]|nr:DnaD domain protein [Anaerolineaceae bacterium]